MKAELDSRSGLMARLTISALEKATNRNPSSWKHPLVHRALLVSGLSIFLASIELLVRDLDNC